MPAQICRRGPVSIQHLERRQFLSGTASISGSVYNDLNHNAVHESGEAGVKSARVYLDYDNDGAWDKGVEPATLTDKRGAFSFDKLGAGTYRLREVMGPDMVGTAPSSGWFRVTLSDGQVITRRLFGQHGIGQNALPIDQNGVTITQDIIAARNGGVWNSAGVTSTAAKNTVHAGTTVGVLTGSEYLAAGGSGSRTGSATDTLVKYTYYGDTDFNGKVNFDDYVRTDNGFNNPLTGSQIGDVDGNGVVNFDDYVAANPALGSADAKTLARSDVIAGKSQGGLANAVKWISGKDKHVARTGVVQRVIDHYHQLGADYKRQFLKLSKTA